MKRQVLTVGDSRYDETHATIEIPDGMSDFAAVTDWLGTHTKVEWPIGHRPAGVRKYRALPMYDTWAQIEVQEW